MNLRPDTLREVAHSYQLGFRDALQPRLALSSIVVGGLATLVMLLVFVSWHNPIGQWSGEVVNAGLTRVWHTPNELLVSALKWLMMATLFVLGFVLLMQLVLQFWLMQRIQKVCLRRHPALHGLSEDSGFRHGVMDGVRTFSTWALGGLLCLFIPVLGGVLLLVLSSYLAVRSLINDSLEGLASDVEVRTLIRESRPEMLGLGLLIALSALIPLVGFLVPVLTGASTCHLMMTRLARLRSAT